MKNFKLIRSNPASAEYNMGLDAEIFQQYLKDGVGVLRIYRWESPSFTYGFSQAPEDEIDLAAACGEGVQVAKRITGGGILFHNDEITYSFACNKSDIGEPQNVFVSYRTICAFLINFYESVGLKADFALNNRDFSLQSQAHKLCSASCEKYDIVINAKKIGGNAQRRNRQAIFQHGVIPCSIDWDFVRRFTKNLPADISKSVTTLSDELRIVPSKDILEEKLIAAFEKTFQVNFYETCMA